MILAAVLGGSTGDSVELDAWRTADSGVVRSVLALGRRAFDAYVTKRDVIDPPAGLPDLFHRRAAVFVSAMRNGAPRCCMGTLYPTEPDAAHEIVASAITAAGRDRRFKPIKGDELKGLTLIVSIVGSPQPITAEEAGHLDPTRSGLAVRYGYRYGVVLSCETTRNDRMISWARIRAGAPPTGRVEFFRLQDVRFVEDRRGRDSASR